MPKDKPKTALRRWMQRTGTTEEQLADLLGALPGYKRPHPRSVRMVACGTRDAGHRLASALSAVTGLPYSKLKPLPSFDTDAA